MQLRLSDATALRQKLRRLISRSALPNGIFANIVLGCDENTICNYLAGKKIPQSRASQIRNIDTVLVKDGTVAVIHGYRHNDRWNMLVRRREVLQSLRTARNRQERRVPAFRGPVAVHHMTRYIERMQNDPFLISLSLQDNRGI